MVAVAILDFGNCQ